MKDRCVSPGCENPAQDGGRCLDHARDLRVARGSSTVSMFDDVAAIAVDARPLLEELANFRELYQEAMKESGWRAWDKLAEHLGLDPENPEQRAEARYRLGIARPVGPRKTASVRCQSGRRDYCTCDTCW